MSLLSVALEDRYAAVQGPVLMSGIQALVRLVLEQRRLDDARGLNTGGFVSGYPGSPLGGFDRELVKAHRRLAAAGVVFQPGVNEELAATAVSGSQLVGELAGRRVDGVSGYWFGKAPGLDRAADAIRHANTSGTAHLGGAVALIGDDPLCKSSTLPSSSELMAESLVLPLFTPGSVQDIVRLGLHAVALSRQAGLWTAMKITADVADSSAVVSIEDLEVEVPMPPMSGRGGPPMLIGASSVAAEADLIGARTEQAIAYGREHRLNRITFEPTSARTAIVAPAPVYRTLLRGLEQIGLAGKDEWEPLGLRLVELGMVWPLHPDDIAEFAQDVDTILVLEDKRAFVERQIRDAMYGIPDPPQILGKRDAQGHPLVPFAGAVDSDTIARVLGRHLGLPRNERPTTAVSPAAVRTPFFCSGCPHNLSTRSPEDQLVGAGIGCHALVALDPARERGQLLGAPQMGGEGAQWIGMAPFTSDEHYVQNLGDGTFFHSGSLAIRSAVAAGVKITFRLLYNDAVAMTGGQTPPGQMQIPELTRWLELEGVRRIVVTTEDPESFGGAQLSQVAEVRHRDGLQTALAELRQLDGVTVLIHTDRCATEERRLRKRGKLPAAAQRAWINERVCEGCGDCGKKSSCLSVIPIETEFGRKTAIHQSSCTQDLACLEGDCPSFLLVTPGTEARRSPVTIPGVELTEPTPRIDLSGAVLIRMPGVGGTGVVTIAQILQMSALIDGKWASGLDQTGLAQKGGAVVSDIRIGPAADSGSLRAGRGEVDVLIGLDLLGMATADTLRTIDAERTVAIGNLGAMPTTADVTDPDAQAAPVREIVTQVEANSRRPDALWLDAKQISEQVFGDHMQTNMIMLGAAYQHGCVPVSAAAIERAIELNGAAVAQNLEALHWGRAAVVDRLAVERAVSRSVPTAPAQRRPRTVDRELSSAIDRLGLGDADLRGRVKRLAADLESYQSRRYAMAYVKAVGQVHAAERATLPAGVLSITVAYAGGLHKLMAYKDEYEVARLHLDELERARFQQEFGESAKVQVLLHPPLLRALGMKRKLKLEHTARPLFRALHEARILRGTRLDPFGRTQLRRLERDLVIEYRQAVQTALRSLTSDTQEQIAELAALPDAIRGYERIKLENVERYRSAMAAALDRLRPANGPLVD